MHVRQHIRSILVMKRLNATSTWNSLRNPSKSAAYAGFAQVNVFYRHRKARAIPISSRNGFMTHQSCSYYSLSWSNFIKQARPSEFFQSKEHLDLQNKSFLVISMQAFALNRTEIATPNSLHETLQSIRTVFVKGGWFISSSKETISSLLNISDSDQDLPLPKHTISIWCYQNISIRLILYMQIVLLLTNCSTVR